MCKWVGADTGVCKWVGGGHRGVHVYKGADGIHVYPKSRFKASSQGRIQGCAGEYIGADGQKPSCAIDAYKLQQLIVGHHVVNHLFSYPQQNHLFQYVCYKVRQQGFGFGGIMSLMEYAKSKSLPLPLNKF